jgi:hypothetical protein
VSAAARSGHAPLLLASRSGAIKRRPCSSLRPGCLLVRKGVPPRCNADPRSFCGVREGALSSLLTSRSAPPEPAPRPPRRIQFLGLAPLEVILLVLAGLAAGFGIGLLVGSTEATVGATLFGGVLVAAGTFRTIQVAREGQLTERFSKATEQLDAKDSDGKREQLLVLGGIYSLERIAAESRLDYYPIMEVLTAFVRASARLPEGAAIQDRVDPSPCQYKLPDDVQAALAVLARRNPRRGEYRLDLGSADLRNAKLPHARFGMAILSGSDLRAPTCAKRISVAPS